MMRIILSFFIVILVVGLVGAYLHSVKKIFRKSTAILAGLSSYQVQTKNKFLLDDCQVFNKFIVNKFAQQIEISNPIPKPTNSLLFPGVYGLVGSANKVLYSGMIGYETLYSFPSGTINRSTLTLIIPANGDIMLQFVHVRARGSLSYIPAYNFPRGQRNATGGAVITHFRQVQYQKVDHQHISEHYKELEYDMMAITPSRKRSGKGKGKAEAKGVGKGKVEGELVAEDKEEEEENGEEEFEEDEDYEDGEEEEEYSEEYEEDDEDEEEVDVEGLIQQKMEYMSKKYRFTRKLKISYLDDEIMIMRDSLNNALIFRRKELTENDKKALELYGVQGKGKEEWIFPSKRPLEYYYIPNGFDYVRIK